jgi:hypothetical protein
MASSFAGIIGIVLFVLACKNVNKTYREKSLFLRIGICTGLFFAGMILAILFLLMLNPSASPESLGENSILFLGFFADVISLILRFFHIKKHSKTSSKEYKSARNELILSIIIPVIIFIALFGFDFYKSASCQYPKMLIGDECCVPNTDFGIPMCNDEAKKNQQLNHAIENDILTTEKTENIMGKFSLMVPPDYYAIRNSKAGYYDIPLFLISYDEYGNAIMIRVMYSESSNYGETIYDFYYDFKKGLDQSTPQAVTTEPQFFENEENGFEIAIFNMTANIGGIETFSSQALIKSDNEVLIVSYLSDNEVENMVWSADRIG